MANGTINLAAIQERSQKNRAKVDTREETQEWKFCENSIRTEVEKALKDTEIQSRKKCQKMRGMNSF